MKKWIDIARELGFDEAAKLDVGPLAPLEAIRDMCASDKCRAFGKNWTCPPACGDLSECAEKMQQYQTGILLQTVGKMEKVIDIRAMAATEQRHLELFHRFCELVRLEQPDALCLGTGGCRICGSCAYPEPCRYPEKACSSMEGYGLFVTQVCRDNGIPYYHGEKTITYTACVLLDRHTEKDS